MNTNPPAANDLEMSLNDWAGTLGTNPDTVLAITGSIFAALAGPGATLGLPWGAIPLPATNLLLHERRATTSLALETLLSPVRHINLRVLESMAAVNRRMLDYQQAGTFATNPSKANPDGSTEWAALQRLTETTKPQRGSLDVSSACDLSPSASALRFEAMRRPALLLEGARINDLAKLLLGCHRLHALAILRLPPELDGQDPRKQLAALAELLDGCELAIPQDKTIQGIELNHPARLHAIFRMDSQAWERLFGEAPQLLERCLLVGHQGTAANPTPDQEGAAAFSRFYAAAVTEIGMTRREGHFLQVGFDDPAAASFQTRLNAHSVACDRLPQVGPAARMLPVTLIWALLILSRQMTDRQGTYAPTDLQIIDTGFAATGRLLDRHHQCLTGMETVANRESMLAIASRVVLKVRGREPISERQLVRTFTHQKLSIYRPVINTLVSEQVLELTPEGLLQLGQRPFEDAQRDIWPAAMAV